MTTRSATVDETQVGRLDQFVRSLLAMSWSQARGLIDRGCVTVNGRCCQSIGDLVACGDVVSVGYDPHQRYKESKKSWDDRTFTIAFEDDAIIVVDKSAGTLTVPTDHEEPNTLVERVSVYLSHSRSAREAFVVHRLDREVSGLLVFGKQQEIAEQLIEQFKQRKPERLYTAIVAGIVSQDQGTFHSYLATAKNLSRFSTRPSKDSEEAITHFRVLQRKSDTTLVEVRLETGKRNQIRVHFAEAGHPVLGDPRYKKGRAAHPRWKRKRIALHASSLRFQHPVSGKEVLFESPLPSAMKKFLASPR
jgi:23S rRNA pseudouridine1911/1915/1917 synthase